MAEPAWTRPAGRLTLARRAPDDLSAPEAAGRHCQLAAQGFHLWTLAVGVAIMGDAILRAVYAFIPAGPVSELCSLGVLSSCVDPALIATANLGLGAAEAVASLGLIAAEVPRSCCTRCVVRYCGVLATFGGKGVYLLTVGSVVALSGQGLYVGPAGLGLAHVIIGVAAFITGAVLVLLASPCVAMPSHPTRDHYHRVVALVKADLSRDVLHSLEVPMVVAGTPIVPPPADSSSGARESVGIAVAAPPGGKSSKAPESNPFYGNQHLSNTGGASSV